MADIYIAKDFTPIPGGRLKAIGENSGEEFREKFLEKYFLDGNTETINIYLDGTEGYLTSFLEESFGGLVRKFHNKELIKKRINLISKDEVLTKEIIQYIDEAE